MQLRDECLTNIRADLGEKEKALKAQLDKVTDELAARSAFLLVEDINSKKFLRNVLETRLNRHQTYAKQYYMNAEKKLANDPRIQKFL